LYFINRLIIIKSHCAKKSHLQNNKLYQYITAEKHYLAISVFDFIQNQKSFSVIG